MQRLERSINDPSARSTAGPPRGLELALESLHRRVSCGWRTGAPAIDPAKVAASLESTADEFASRSRPTLGRVLAAASGDTIRDRGSDGYPISTASQWQLGCSPEATEQK